MTALFTDSPYLASFRHKAYCKPGFLFRNPEKDTKYPFQYSRSMTSTVHYYTCAFCGVANTHVAEDCTKNPHIDTFANGFDINPQDLKMKIVREANAEFYWCGSQTPMCTSLKIYLEEPDSEQCFHVVVRRNPSPFPFDGHNGCSPYDILIIEISDRHSRKVTSFMSDQMVQDFTKGYLQYGLQDEHRFGNNLDDPVVSDTNPFIFTRLFR